MILTSFGRNSWMSMIRNPPWKPPSWWSASLGSSGASLVRERLLQQYPETDDETIRDTLEGITDLHEMIAAVIRSALVDEALHAGLRFRVDDMKERLSRLELRAAKKRQLALEAMTEGGRAKLEQPDFTASARAGTPALVVVAEGAIPKVYWLPQPPKLDRQALLGELRRGADIAGAQLSNPCPVLTVRTK
jgi:Gp157 protein